MPRARRAPAEAERLAPPAPPPGPAPAPDRACALIWNDAGLGGPRTPCSRRPPATSPRFHVEAANRDASPLRSAFAAACDVPPGTVERSSRPRRPLAQPARATRSPRAKGRFTRRSAKSHAICRAQGAFRRGLPPEPAPSLRSGASSAGRVFSTGCHQPVGNTRRTFRLRTDADLDGSTAAETRSPSWLKRAGARFSQAGG